MAEFQDILGDVVADRQPGTATPVLNLRNGVVWQAEIEGPLDPIVLTTELGDDPREKVALHVLADSDFKMNDIVQFTLYGTLWKCQILKRDMSPAAPMNTYFAARVTGHDEI